MCFCTWDIFAAVGKQQTEWNYSLQFEVFFLFPWSLSFHTSAPAPSSLQMDLKVKQLNKLEAAPPLSDLRSLCFVFFKKIFRRMKSQRGWRCRWSSWPMRRWHWRHRWAYVRFMSSCSRRREHSVTQHAVILQVIFYSISFITDYLLSPAPSDTVAMLVRFAPSLAQKNLQW